MKTNNKCHEALELCIDELCNRCRANSAAQGNPLPCLTGCEVVRKAKAALSAPLRNCDVGTPSERTSRYVAFCDSHVHCADCPCNKIAGDCEFSWGDMPYSEGGDNADE